MRRADEIRDNLVLDIHVLVLYSVENDILLYLGGAEYYHPSTTVRREHLTSWRGKWFEQRRMIVLSNGDFYIWIHV